MPESGYFMKKAVIGAEGYLKECCLCGKCIENEMYEEIQSTRSKIKRYFHVKCYTQTKSRKRYDRR